MKLKIYLAFLQAGKPEQEAKAIAEAISDFIDNRIAKNLKEIQNA
jgi:hypothetical protein